MNTQEKVAAAGRMGAVAAKQFLSENRELLASFDWPAVEKSMYAYLQLHARSDMEQSEPSIDLYIQLQRIAFISLLDKQAIVPVAPITSLGQKALDAMRIATGIGVASLPAPVAIKTPQEALEDQIVVDYTNLSTNAFMAKVQSNREYRETWKRLAETDRIVVRPQKSVSDAQLEQEVIASYRSMPSKDFQAKRRNSPAFNAMFEKLSNDNRISL